MTPHEEIVGFGDDGTLIGVVSYPRAFDSRRPAIILISPMFMNRMGVNRLNVKMARHLANRGFLCIRFDYSGVGESLPRRDDIPRYTADILETIAALDFLHQAFGVRQAIAAGVCWGAMVGLYAALQDSRIVGLMLVDPEILLAAPEESAVFTVLSERRTFWLLLDPARWLRFLRGQTAYRERWRGLVSYGKALLKPGARRREASAASTQLEGLCERGVRIVFLFSPPCRGYAYFQAIRKDRPMPAEMAVAVIPQQGSTFWTLASQVLLLEEMEKFLRHWLQH